MQKILDKLSAIISKKDLQILEIQKKLTEAKLRIAELENPYESSFITEDK